MKYNVQALPNFGNTKKMGTLYKKNPASSPASRLGEERPGQQQYKGKQKNESHTTRTIFFFRPAQ